MKNARNQTGLSHQKKCQNAFLKQQKLIAAQKYTIMGRSADTLTELIRKLNYTLGSLLYFCTVFIYAPHPHEYVASSFFFPPRPRAPAPRNALDHRLQKRRGSGRLLQRRRRTHAHRRRPHADPASGRRNRPALHQRNRRVLRKQPHQ